jgi:hypothetical protein
MTVTTEPHTKSILVLSFATRPRPRVLSYLEFLADEGVSVDLVVWDAKKWRTADLEPALPAQVRVFELRAGERALFTQRLKRLLMYTVPTKTLRGCKKITNSNPVTRPLNRVVGLAQKVHKRGAKVAERRVFGVYNQFFRPRRLARVAKRTLGRNTVDFARVGRVVSAESYSITYAWQLTKRLPDVPATFTLDRSPLPSA